MLADGRQAEDLSPFTELGHEWRRRERDSNTSSDSVRSRDTSRDADGLHHRENCGCSAHHNMELLRSEQCVGVSFLPFREPSLPTVMEVDKITETAISTKQSSSTSSNCQMTDGLSLIQCLHHHHHHHGITVVFPRADYYLIITDYKYLFKKCSTSAPSGNRKWKY